MDGFGTIAEELVSIGLVILVGSWVTGYGESLFPACADTLFQF